MDAKGRRMDAMSEVSNVVKDVGFFSEGLK